MPTELDTAVEANRLYWETGTSVADIADRLDLSRRALYDAIKPLRAGLTCEVCGGELTYENRSSRAAGQTNCLRCEARVEEADEAVEEAEVEAGPRIDQRTLQLGGAMLAGAALGAVATLLVVHRR